MYSGGVLDLQLYLCTLYQYVMNEVSEYSKWQVHFFTLIPFPHYWPLLFPYLVLPHCIFRQCSIVPNKCHIVVIYQCSVRSWIDHGPLKQWSVNRLCIQIVPSLFENQDTIYQRLTCPVAADLLDWLWMHPWQNVYWECCSNNLFWVQNIWVLLG